MATVSTFTLPQNARNKFYPPPPTTWELFKYNPVLFLAKSLYTISQSRFLPTPPSTQHPPIKIVCISDTHTTTPSVPDGDILLHAGDLTNSGSFQEMQNQLDWLNSLPHAHKVAIAGNHDLVLDTEFVKRMPAYIPSLGGSASDLIWGDIVYLQNSSTTLKVHGREIHIFGNPDTPQYGNWAFQYPSSEDRWSAIIPPATDVLLCHGPPRGHLDLNGKGCAWLQKELWRVRPRLCVFGHIHEGRGREDVGWDRVQRAYDGVVRGERGWGALVEMGIAVIGGKFWELVSGKRMGCTTLVNAAVALERDSELGWKNRVVEI
jgi:predicted phosphodiesterase